MRQSSIFSRTIVIWILALICCALWGSAFSCVKIGYALFQISSQDVASQMLFAGCRFTLAGILAITFASIQQHQLILPKSSALTKVLLLCLFQTVLQYSAFYIGLAHTTGVKASIINGTNNVFAIFIAVYLFHMEKMSPLKALGCTLGLLGLILVNIQGADLDFSFNPLGDGLMIITAIAAAASTVLLRVFSRDENPVMLSGYQFFAGGIFLVVLAVLMGGTLHPVSWKAYLLLLYMAMISSVAYSLWGILLKYNTVSKITVFGFMTPVFGVFISALLLKEYDQLGFACLLSLILVCLGIFFTNRANARESETEKIETR